MEYDVYTRVIKNSDRLMKISLESHVKRDM